jgi:hypothetical protein
MASSFHVSGPHGPKGGPVVLVNGHTEQRQRSSEGVVVLECGCAFTDWPSQWLQMCTPSHVDTQQRHDDAMLEHQTKPDAAWLDIT